MKTESEAEVLVKRGIHLSRKGKHLKSSELFLHALELVPRHPVISFNLALEYLALRKPEKALFCLKVSTVQDPENPDYWCETGVALYELKDYAGAEKAFDKAVSFGGENSRLWNSFGVLRFVSEEYTCAAEFFNRALSLDPGNADAWFNLADTYDVLGDGAGAAEARREYGKLTERG